jgi:mycofactocin precursor
MVQLRPEHPIDSEETVQTDWEEKHRPSAQEDEAAPVAMVADQEALARDSGSPAANDAPLVLADLLVEDVSIDGMCGVY